MDRLGEYDGLDQARARARELGGTMRCAERGFSLVEVVIALGLLAGVLVAISGLFVVAAKQVNSGRASSQALAAAKEIQEELYGWGFSQLWEMFGFDGRASAYTVDSRTNTACAVWQDVLAKKLGPSAYATVSLTSVETAAGATSNFADASGNALAKAVRVSVTVTWTEVPGRERTITVGTMRN